MKCVKEKSSIKHPKDRHRKVDGRDRRVFLTVECAGQVFEIKKKLGHRYAGETIEWLLIQAAPAVNAVLGTNATFPESTSPVAPPEKKSENPWEIEVEEPTMWLFK